MQKVIIVSGHGNFASGLQSSIELLAGKNEGVYFVDFVVEDSDITLRDKFIRILEENTLAEVLFVCDILGGTPFKTAAELGNDKENIEVVAGCNVGAIVEAILKREIFSIGQLAEEIVSRSKSYTIRFEKVSISDKVASSTDFEEGI
jgi:PTS system N-acetylgalactosamine-specific IIA component